MTIIIKASIACVFLLGLSMSNFGQTTRVSFSRGSTSMVIKGNLHGYKDHRTYLIRVRRGQTLKTESIGRNAITVEITAPPGSTYEPDMAADCHDHHEVSPTARGDYRIRITECAKADAWRGTFRLRVSVR